MHFKASNEWRNALIGSEFYARRVSGLFVTSVLFVWVAELSVGKVRVLDAKRRGGRKTGNHPVRRITTSGASKCFNA